MRKAIGVLAVAVVLGGSAMFGFGTVPIAQAQTAAAPAPLATPWCKVFHFQFEAAMEAKLGELYGQGATIVSNSIDSSSSFPYAVLVCKR